MSNLQSSSQGPETTGSRAGSGEGNQRPEALRAILLENLDRVQRTIDYVCCRNAVPPWDAQDFEGWVKLKLVDRDYAVLRKFRGQSQASTYLTTVIHNLFRDFRIQKWGKWRPSAAARRAGNVGIQLEALLFRDGFSMGEAIQLLRNRYSIEETDADLERIASTIKPRPPRRYHTDSGLNRLKAPGRVDEGLRDDERERALRRTGRILQEVLATLEPEDRLILKMRFGDGLTVAQISRTMSLEQRPLYSRLQRILRCLKEAMEDEGIHREEVIDIVGWPGFDMEFDYRVRAASREPSDEFGEPPDIHIVAGDDDRDGPSATHH